MPAAADRLSRQRGHGVSSASRITTYSATVGEVEARLSEEYGDYWIADTPATMHDDVVRTADFALNRCSIGGAVALESVSRELIIGAPTGIYHWSTDEEAGDATRAPILVRPGVRQRTDLADTVVYCISLDLASLERTAQRMYADDGLRVSFESNLPIAGADTRRLRDIVQRTVVERDLVLESDLVAASLYRRVAASVTQMFPLRGDPVDRVATVTALATGYRRAVRFIDDYASLPITLEDIAAAAGLSTRQLDAAFRWHSPHERPASDALRRARLDAARSDLLRGHPSRGDTVREIALRWGYSPRGFTRAYLREFGRSPGDVLRS